MNDSTLVIGIDCATKANKVGIAMGYWDGHRLVVTEARRGDALPDWHVTVAEWIKEASDVLIALDAPLGWPRAMGSALVSHSAGKAISVDANCLFMRETDRIVEMNLHKIVKDKAGNWVRRQALKPLDVGANLIARTAHSALESLDRIAGLVGAGQIPLAKHPGQVRSRRAIEVYPAATLSAHGMPCEQYKKDGQGNRSDVVAWVCDKVEIKESAEGERIKRAICDGDHVLDAAICLVAATDFLTGNVIPQEPDSEKLAEKEGWIWVAPEKGM